MERNKQKASQLVKGTPVTASINHPSVLKKGGQIFKFVLLRIRDCALIGTLLIYIHAYTIAQK